MVDFFIITAVYFMGFMALHRWKLSVPVVEVEYYYKGSVHVAAAAGKDEIQ